MKLKFKSLIDLLTAFPNEKSCKKYLEEIIWEGNPVSPFDPNSKVYKYKNGRYRCKNTGKYFNILTGSIFENTKIPLRKWFIALYLFTNTKKGISSYQLQRELGVTQKTAWFLLHRLRTAFNVEELKKDLSGDIEVDETFIGGKNKNRHRDKKIKYSQGRSFKDKTPVLGLLERCDSEIIERPHKLQTNKIVKEKIISKPSRLLCYIVSDTKTKSIQPIVRSKVKFGSTIHSDEWFAYRGLSNGYTHNVIDHRKGQYADGNSTTNRIEGCWSHLKRNVLGVYHNVSKQHLHRYVDEYSLRYNTRYLNVCERFDLIIESSKNKRLLYKQLINGKKF